MIDIHCHILPEVDDGADTLDQAKKMLQIAYNDGIRHIITTPHWQTKRFELCKEEYEEKIALLQEAASEISSELCLYPGREVLYESGIIEKLKSNQIYTLADSDFILIEFIPFTQFYTILNAVREIQSEGLIPIIAHAERYSCLQERRQSVEELRRYRARIQVNAESIVGKIGFLEERRLKKWLKSGYVDYIATDAHSDGRRAPKLSQAYQYVKWHFGIDKAEKIFFENPKKILKIND